MPPRKSISPLVLLVLLTPHSSSLSPCLWAVRPSALPCAGGFPPQRPPSKPVSPPSHCSPALLPLSSAVLPLCEFLHQRPAGRQPSRKSPRILQILLQTAQPPRLSPTIQKIPKNPANPTPDSAKRPAKDACPARLPVLKESTSQVVADSRSWDKSPRPRNDMAILGKIMLF